MYRLKKDCDLTKYGFKQGFNYPNYEEILCNVYEYKDYWLLPMNPDDEDEVYVTEYEHPIWSVHVQENGRLWIECEPDCTYHIDNSDMEEMFYQLMRMIQDDVIYDDYKIGE